MDRPPRQSCEECTFQDAVDVEVSEPGHGFGKDLCNSFYSICPSAQFRPFTDEP